MRYRCSGTQLRLLRGIIALLPAIVTQPVDYPVIPAAAEAGTSSAIGALANYVGAHTIPLAKPRCDSLGGIEEMPGWPAFGR